MGSFLNRLSAVARSDWHQNVTLNSRKLTAEKRRKNAKRGQFFSPRAVQGGQLGTRQGFLHFGMLRVVEAIKRELGLPNEIEGAVPIIKAANAVIMGIVPEEGSTLPWAVFLSRNLRIHAVVS